jgi:trehalose synthase-fused probable maltokinase
MVDRGARLGVDGRLDDEAMLPYLREQRWFGAHDREVSSASLVDVVLLTDDPVLEVALVDVHFEAGAHDLYQLLLRDEGGGLFDATTDPDLGTRLVELASEQAERATGAGRLSFSSIRPVRAPAVPNARALGGEQTNTVVVVGDLLVKTYRRVHAGVNPELDMLLFFAEHDYPNVPELVGWYGYEGERVQATLGLLQRFLPDAIDGWALGTAEAREAPAAFLARLHRLGTVVGEMHGVLASDASDPAFAPEDPPPESAGLVTARIDEEIDTTFDELGDREEFAPLAGRRGEAHDLLGMLAQSTTLGRNIRTHGDLHLGQVLWQGDDWRVIDFEGEPGRAVASRRQKTQPLRDVAGMLRSFSYLAATLDRAGHRLPATWEQEARDRFLAGYRDTAAVAVLPGTLEAQDGELVMFELEKAFYELRYELDHRPDWVDIPVRSIAALLDRDAG